MGKINKYVLSGFLVCLASAYPFCMKAADLYRERTFLPWFSLTVQILFSIVLAWGIVLFIRKEEKRSKTDALFSLLSLVIAWYLYMECPYTFGIFPVYNLLVAFLLLSNLWMGRR